MSGINYRSQINMLIPPTEESHIARIADVVDLIAQKVKNPVRAAQDANLPGDYLVAPDLTLTLHSTAVLTVDGVVVEVGDRILLMGQTDATQNGIYVVTQQGDVDTVTPILTRAADFDESAKISEHVRVPVSQGVFYKDTAYSLATDDPIVLDTTSLSFVPATGPVTKISQKVFDIAGDAGTVDFAVTHSFGTRDVTVTVYDKTQYADVIVDVARNTANQITLKFGEAPAVGEDYRVIVRAETSPFI
jgi:hypothetical protein